MGAALAPQSLYSDQLARRRPEVLYFANGATAGSAPTDASNPYSPNDYVTILGPGNLARTIHAFVGWSTSPDGTGVAYAPGASFPITISTALYARWNARRVVGAERAHTPAEVVARPGLLADVEYVFTTWNGPRLDAAFHAAGTVRGLVTLGFWASGIPISNAQVANGLPVADFAYGQILLALKGFWRLSRDCRRRGALSPDRLDGPGVAEATVGLISLGGIARALVERLAPHSASPTIPTSMRPPPPGSGWNW